MRIDVRPAMPRWGAFFLPVPLVETLPIPDFRVMGGEWPRRPCPNLLETIYVCQQRQEWHRDHAIAEREDRLKQHSSQSAAAVNEIGRKRENIPFPHAFQVAPACLRLLMSRMMKTILL